MEQFILRRLSKVEALTTLTPPTAPSNPIHFLSSIHGLGLLLFAETASAVSLTEVHGLPACPP